MKVFTFRYQKNIRKNVLSEMREVMRTKKSKVHENEMLCDSVEAILKCVSKSRMEAFLAIVEYNPSSIYELAQILEKNQANVLRDVNALESMGLIRLFPVKEGNREKLKPEALYDMVVVELGQHLQVHSSDQKNVLKKAI